MTPDDRLNEAIAAFQRLEVPARPELILPAASVAADANPDYSRRRLMMKLSIGGLAAALALGLVALTATPQVTMAQAVAEVKKHKTVRYQTAGKVELVVQGKPVVAERLNIILEDLNDPRYCIVETQTHGGKASATMAAFDTKSGRMILISPAPLDHVKALKTAPVSRDEPKRVDLFGIPKADLAEYLAKSGYLTDLERVVIAGVQWNGTRNGNPSSRSVASGVTDAMRKRPLLLDRMTKLARDKGSVTTRVTLDGNPAIKIVGTEVAWGIPRGDDDKKRLPITVWLDPETRLPLRVEQAEFGQVGGNVSVLTGFEWDPKLPAGVTADKLFSTEPPKGYPLTIVVD